jgi:hypothetical protein
LAQLDIEELKACRIWSVFPNRLHSIINKSMQDPINKSVMPPLVGAYLLNAQKT